MPYDWYKITFYQIKYINHEGDIIKVHKNPKSLGICEIDDVDSEEDSNDIVDEKIDEFRAKKPRLLYKCGKWFIRSLSSHDRLIKTALCNTFCNLEGSIINRPNYDNLQFSDVITIKKIYYAKSAKQYYNFTRHFYFVKNLLTNLRL